jgi:superfamily II DNA/RNA helicase
MSKSNHGTIANFQNFALAEPILEALEALSFETPTPIQAESLPHTLTGKDLIGCAQTGTGKTAAFLIPLLTKLLEDEEAQALVLAPTRELALQIQGVAHDLAQRIEGFRSVLLIGGVSLFPQKKDLARKPALIVGTPGRIVDHLRQRTLDLSRVRSLVLDEADRMLDMGFAPQLRVIRDALPKERQTMLFSATMPIDILKLAQQYLRDPARVTIGEVSKPVERIEQVVIPSSQVGKNDGLLDELNKEPGSVLIFTRTKRRADKLARFLNEYGHKISVIHGDRSQRQREEAIERFREGASRILVATDIASRGIDIPEIQLVVNFDLPDCPEDYVHRIGRTARAGKEGKAILFVTPEDREEWNALQKFLSKKGKELENPSFAGIAKAPRPEGEGARRPRSEGWKPREANGSEQPRAERRPGPSRYGQSTNNRELGTTPGSRYAKRAGHGEGNSRFGARRERPFPGTSGSAQPRRDDRGAPRPWQQREDRAPRFGSGERPQGGSRYGQAGGGARFGGARKEYGNKRSWQKPAFEGQQREYDGSQRAFAQAQRENTSPRGAGYAGDKPRRAHGARKEEFPQD